MCTASSAKRTTADSASAVEKTATDLTPSSRHARATRRAISPRFAIRTFSNTLLRRLQVDQNLLELHPRAVLDDDLGDLAGLIGQDLVHQLHRLDDPDCLSDLDHVA